MNFAQILVGGLVGGFGVLIARRFTIPAVAPVLPVARFPRASVAMADGLVALHAVPAFLLGSNLAGGRKGKVPKALGGK